MNCTGWYPDGSYVRSGRITDGQTSVMEIRVYVCIYAMQHKRRSLGFDPSLTLPPVYICHVIQYSFGLQTILRLMPHVSHLLSLTLSRTFSLHTRYLIFNPEKNKIHTLNKIYLALL